MNTELKSMLASIQLGEAKTLKNITLFPIICPGDGSPAYLTLGEAIGTGGFLVTETSQAGTVPELMVVNRLNQPVLLLDGEELRGAKQNRVLNTTILLKENSQTTIPVSCTEQGRWSHVSPSFADSGVHMAHQLRARKTSSVSESLAMGASFHSDQGEVWAGITKLHALTGSTSPTGAMRAAYEARQADLDQYQKAFAPIPGQNGLLVLADGEVAGFDFVSRPDAYAKLHSKLLKSYIIEAVARPGPVTLDPAMALDKATAFLAEIGQCAESQFPSIGYGVDLRLQKPGLTGSALAHENRVIHSAFFRLPPGDQPDRMAALRHRRGHL